MHRKISKAERAAARMDARLAIAGAVVARYEELAREKGLTRSAIAERLGCSRAHVSRLLSGNGNWTLDTVGDLLAAMDAHLATVTVADTAAAPATNEVHPWTEPLATAETTQIVRRGLTARPRT